MGSTPNRGYRYPVGTDTPSVVRDVKNLADDVDVDVGILLPAAMIVAYGGNTIPTGWLLCNGQTFDTGLNPNLFAALGASTVPDLVDRFVKGSATSGATGGSKTITAANMPSHNHTGPNHSHTIAHTHAFWHTHYVSTNSAGSHHHSLYDSGGSGQKAYSAVWNDNEKSRSQAGMTDAGNHSHAATSDGPSPNTTGGSNTGSSGNSGTQGTGYAGSGTNFEPKFYALIYMIRAG